MYLEIRCSVRIIWESWNLGNLGVFCWWQRFENLHILPPLKSSTQLFLARKIQVVIYHQKRAILVPKAVKLQETETPGRCSDDPLVLLSVFPSILVVVRRLTRGKHENQWAGSHRRGWCLELQQLMSLPELRIFQPGVSPLIGREGTRRRAGVKHQCHVLSLFLPCWCPFMGAVSPREPAVEVS